jgi:hypothetical protein
MTVALGRRRPPAVDLSHQGVHRDPGTHDPLAAGTFTQRLAHRAAGLLGGRSSRRSFLTRTAMVGSALAVGPMDYLLKPGTAYGYVCGSCGDGWTAFCCTINSGRNSCPPGSFIAGWWKADNAAYCCGAARYILDCNASCPTQCGCRCSGASCDGRRTCCNQFRYGQCHQEISCYGPVVCRVATCTPPWRYDPSCTTASATDNATRDHGAPCVATECGTAISRKYDSLGGRTGFLGPVVQAERAITDGRGRYATYQGGSIYWTSTTGAHEVHGDILTEWGRVGSVRGALGYPTSDTLTTSDEKARYSNFEKGRVYYRSPIGALALPNPFFTKHESLGGVHGTLGYPITSVRTSSDKKSTFVNFAKTGRIYAVAGRVVEVHGAVYTHHESIGGVHGTLGYPVNDLSDIGDGRGKSQWFDGGIVWYSPTTGAFGQWGAILDRYATNGHCRGYLRYPTSTPQPVGDGRGTFATYERGRIYATPTTDAHQVHGAVLTAWLDTHGGPTGSLGYPTTELDPAGTAGGRFQTFEGGRLEYRSDGTVVLA